MRRFLIISIVVSFVIHYSIFYAFSDSVLFDMGAYDSRMRNIFEVSVGDAPKTFFGAANLDESVNTPEETKVLKKRTEDLVDREKLKRDIKQQEQKLEKRKIERKPTRKPADVLNPLQKSLNQNFGMQAKTIEDPAAKKHVAQEMVTSDFIRTPTRKTIQKSVAATDPNTIRSKAGEGGFKSTFVAASSGGGSGPSAGFFATDSKPNNTQAPSLKNALLFQEGDASKMTALETVRVSQGEIQITGEMTRQVYADFEVYEDAKTKEHFVRIMLDAKEDESYQKIPKDLLFLIDVSGSITIDDLDDVKDEIEEVLLAQNKEDRFNVVLFSVKQEQLYPGFSAISEQAIEEASNFISRIKGSKETNIYDALMRSSTFFQQSDRALHMVFISDARPTEGVKDFKQIINDFTRRRLGNVAFFTYDIGRTRVRPLLQYLSYENRGISFAKNPRDGSKQLPSYMQPFASPFFYDVRVERVDGQGAQVFPRLLRHFYLDATNELFVKLPKKGSVGISLSGKDATGNRGEMYLALNTDIPVFSNDDSIAKDWARFKLFELISTGFREGKTKQLSKEIEKLRKRFGVKVAWELRKYLD